MKEIKDRDGGELGTEEHAPPSPTLSPDEWSRLYRDHSRQVLATLIRLLGDFDLAEEAMHEAFAQALRQWPNEGAPGNPIAWLVSTGRFKAIDQLRKDKRGRDYVSQLAPALLESVKSTHDTEDDTCFSDGALDYPRDYAVSAYEAADAELEEQSIADDQLRLIFTCCHPGLAEDAQLAMTLREMCGLTTEQVARGLLQQPTTIAQRIVRAKRKIRDARIPYEVPGASELPQRLAIVLKVIYLMYNEAYSSSSGDAVVNGDLSAEAIRLCRHLQALLPHPDVAGLMALMLLQDARKGARQNADGTLLTLEQQDRALWDKAQIEEGTQWLDWSLRSGPAGFYTLQAAVAALHTQASRYQDTDWVQITGLYDLLLQMSASPVIALNRAVALAMRDGPEAGLELLDEISESGQLDNYHLLHAARADFYRRLGRKSDAIAAYRQALLLTSQTPEKRFLQGRLAELQSAG
ncbi:MAG: RNA polymerase sigma factor [Pseudohongiella sp.]|nr:RNA polymerase sigma factor [Pseudohongiella sp.]MDP2126718.1 RNA polymerase sigma factor [Pseudohongiella sp.]